MRPSERSVIPMIAVILVGLALALTHARIAYTEQREPTSTTLPGWLAGCWEARTPSDTLEEYWMTPRAATMLGVARLIRRDSVVTYEQNRIERRASRVVLVSSPSAGPRKQYLSIELNSHIARFESRDSVTEQIRYERQGDTLLVRFSRQDARGIRDVEQPMTAVACPHNPMAPR